MSLPRRIGVLGLPGAWSSELLADALHSRTGFRLVIDPAKVSYSGSARRLMADGFDMQALDGLVLRKMGSEYMPHMLDRLQLLRALKTSGVQIVSDPDLVSAVVNRVACTMTLQLADIPMPPTTITEDPEIAEAAVREYGVAVLKPLFSTKARGMLVIRRGEDVAEGLRCFRIAGNPVFYVQKLMDLPGRDLGVVFLGGRHIGTYAREAGPESWNTTIRSGGTYQPYEASVDVVELARRAQALFGLDFTTVDVVETGEGPQVLEVSAFGGFRGLFEAWHTDAAGLLADYVVERIGTRDSSSRPTRFAAADARS